MVNLAEKHDGEHSVQLADAEISRVLSTLKEAEFKRAATGNERPDQTFKPRSLMEIAQTAKQEDEVAKAAAISAEIADHKAAHVADQIINDTVDDVALENTDDDQSHEQRSAGVLDHSLQDTGPEIPLAELNAPDSQDLPETDVGGGQVSGLIIAMTMRLTILRMTRLRKYHLLKRHKRLMIGDMQTEVWPAVRQMTPNFVLPSGLSLRLNLPIRLMPLKQL